MPHASFDGLRVLTLESRRAREVEKLIRTYNGQPVVVPAMREVPLESNTACLEFGRRLLEGDFDLIFFFTGIGVTKILETLDTKYDRERVLDELRRREIIARGVKPAGALKQLEIPVTATVPEPSTWRDALVVLDRVGGTRMPGLRIAVQEYGATNPEFLAELSGRCAEVTKVPVYQWALPLDLELLRTSVRGLVNGEFEVILFMTAIQVIHLFQVAREIHLHAELAQALGRIVVVSVGPTTSEELRHYGIQPDFEPSKPRMGIMVNEAAQYAQSKLDAKRAAASPHETLDAVPQVAVSTPAMAGFRSGLPEAVPHDSEDLDARNKTASRIVNFACEILPCDACLLYAVEEESLVLHGLPAETNSLRLPLGKGVAGWVALHRTPVAIFESAGKDPRVDTAVDFPRGRCEAMLCVPVIAADRVVGVLSLQHRAPRIYSDQERHLLATFGMLVGAEFQGSR